MLGKLAALPLFLIATSALAQTTQFDVDVQPVLARVDTGQTTRLETTAAAMYYAIVVDRTADSGPGTPRAAIEEANSAGKPARSSSICRRLPSKTSAA